MPEQGNSLSGIIRNTQTRTNVEKFRKLVLPGIETETSLPNAHSSNRSGHRCRHPNLMYSDYSRIFDVVFRSLLRDYLENNVLFLTICYMLNLNSQQQAIHLEHKTVQFPARTFSRHDLVQCQGSNINTLLRFKHRGPNFWQNFIYVAENVNFTLNTDFKKHHVIVLINHLQIHPLFFRS